MKTCAESGQRTLFELISSAEVSRAKTSAPLASELACRVLEAAFGMSSGEWSPNSYQAGWLSKTWRAARVDGWMLSESRWSSLAMSAYQSRLRLLISARHTVAHVFSSLLPTPTSTAAWWNRGGGAGRVGKIRPSLQMMARKNLWATPCARDDRGPRGQVDSPGAGRSLPREAGGHLNPAWVEWLMGFPEGWTVVADVPDSANSATPSSRRKQKSSAT
jgi:hypothetical protein